MNLWTYHTTPKQKQSHNQYVYIGYNNVPITNNAI